MYTDYSLNFVVILKFKVIPIPSYMQQIQKSVD